MPVFFFFFFFGRDGLVVIHFFSLMLSWELFLPSSVTTESLAEYNRLGWQHNLTVLERCQSQQQVQSLVAEKLPG